MNTVDSREISLMINSSARGDTQDCVCLFSTTLENENGTISCSLK